jgi:hypothetical protein
MSPGRGELAQRAKGEEKKWVRRRTLALLPTQPFVIDRTLHPLDALVVLCTLGVMPSQTK